ncbi:unnamed protein product, partial [Staurois parvus]
MVSPPLVISDVTSLYEVVMSLVSMKWLGCIVSDVIGLIMSHIFQCFGILIWWEGGLYNSSVYK